MSESHSLFSASASSRWLTCPGSVPMSKGIVDRGSSYAREGTAAHELAAMALQDDRDASAYIGRRIAVEHETYEVDAEMAGHVQTYIDRVRSLRDLLGAKLYVEQRLNYAGYLGVPEAEGFGTGDAVLLADDTIIVIDLKYGAGERVDAEENTQLMLYALGALAKYDIMGPFENVRMLIEQPRNGGSSEWACTREQLLEFAALAKDAAARVKTALKSKAEEFGKPEWQDYYLSPGEKQCRWCKAFAVCPAARKAVTTPVFNSTPATAADFEDTTLMAPNNIEAHIQPTTADWLSASMKAAPFIEHWIKAVRAEVERRLNANEPVPGFKLVQGKLGNREWTDMTEVEKALKAMRLKQEQMYNMSLVSVPTIEKLAPKYDKDGNLKPKQPDTVVLGDRQWKKLQELITRPPGKISVAPESDPRAAVQVSATPDEFENVEASDKSDFA